MKNELLIIMYMENNYNMFDNRIQMLFGQTMSNWNLLILCDNPYLKNDYVKIKKKYDINRNIIFQENEKWNQGNSYNIGIRFFLQHDYRYLAILNDCDKYYPDFLNILWNEQKMFSYGNYHQRKESNKPILRYKDVKDFICNYHGLCNTMWSKEAIQIIGLFDEKKEYASLFDYYIRSFYHFNENQIGYIEQPTHMCICEFNEPKKKERENTKQLRELCQKLDNQDFMEQLKQIILQKPNYQYSVVKNEKQWKTRGVLSKKLYYKLTLYDGCMIQLLRNGLEQCMIKYSNSVVSINHIIRNANSCIFTIWKHENDYELCINHEFVLKINNYDDIKLTSSNRSYYNLSINYPLSLCNFSEENYTNWKYLLTTFQDVHSTYQINIQHVDPLIQDLEIIEHLDQDILEYPCNYIFVKSHPKTLFNLGYCRNLYKYVSWSDNILFSDIDIIVPNIVFQEIYLKTRQGYDVVKPYNNQLIYTTIEEKNDWINNYSFNDESYERFVENLVQKQSFFSLSGGIVLIKKHILETVGGYNELNGYGYEDRMMDVHLLNLPNIKIFKLNYKLFHLYHRSNKRNKKQICIEYNKTYYNCLLYGKDYDLHDQCCHNTDMLSKIEEFHRIHNGNLKLFENINKYHMLCPTLKHLSFIYE